MLDSKSINALLNHLFLLSDTVKQKTYPLTTTPKAKIIDVEII